MAECSTTDIDQMYHAVSVAQIMVQRAHDKVIDHWEDVARRTDKAAAARERYKQRTKALKQQDQ